MTASTNLESRLACIRDIIQWMAMSFQTSNDLLTVLRHNLRIMENSVQTGLRPENFELKNLLLARIGVIEEANARVAKFTATRSQRTKTGQ